MDPSLEHNANLERPGTVAKALQFLFSATAIGLLNAILTLTQKAAGGTMIAVLLIVLAFFVLVFFLVLKISAGRNWARIIWLILIICNLPFAVLSYPQAVRANVITGTLGIIIILLQVIGTVLLFTGSANRWFKRRK